MSKKKVWFLTVVALPISLSTACARKTAPSPEASATPVRLMTPLDLPFVTTYRAMIVRAVS